MLEDPNRDSDMMRRQMTALVVMMGLVWVWFTFFVPKPGDQPRQAEPQPEPVTTAGAPDIVRTAPVATEAAAPGGISLPEVPEQADPALDEVIIEDRDLRLVFTRIGGRLKRADVLLAENGAGNIQLVPQPAGTPDTAAIYPLGLRFSDEHLGDELDYRRFEAEVDSDGRGVTFTLDVPGLALIQKRFRLSEDRHVLDIAISYENRESSARALGLDLVPAYILNWGPSMVVQNEGTTFPPNFVWRTAEETEVFKPKELPQREGVPEDKRIPGSGWLGYKSKYFLTALKPAGVDAIADGWIRGDENAFRFGLYEPAFELAPGAAHKSDYRLYLGPMHLDSLRDAWPTLVTSLRFFGPGGWFGETVSDGMDWFAKLLLRNLNWWHGFIPNYGVAIILLTVLVRMVMFPLMLKQIRSMKQMQALAPEMQALKEKYPDNPQELNKAMMEFYRERKINPLAGCFPIFLQMPVFIALYRMLWNAFELRGATFLWIEDLSMPDALFHLPFMTAVPFVGEVLQYFNLLPILAALAMILSFKLTPTTGPMQNPQQKMMMTLMPIIFMAFSYGFSAGLNLYILVSTLLGILQNQLVRVTDIGGAPVKAAPALATADGVAGKNDHPVKSAVPVSRRKKPQHFYDRAQQRKKEMAKADRKRPKRK
jgi:YidC/Oxa1 family membrane protein insertase